MKLESKTADTKVYREGRYYWTIRGLKADGTFAEIEWRLEKPDNYVGNRLVAKDWQKAYDGRLVAGEFTVTLFDLKGQMQRERSFKLVRTYAGANSPISFLPKDALVADTRSARPGSYRLEGLVPPVSVAEANPIPERKPAEAPRRFELLPVAVATGVLISVAGFAVFWYRRMR